jgi:hypothetical protein
VAVTLASVDGTWVNAGTTSYDAGELRRAAAARYASAGISSGLSVSVDGSDVVTVTAGQVVISGEDAVAGTGVYEAGIAAAVTGSLEARDATNARIDLVVFRQYDTDVVASHPRYKSEIEIIKGTPSATPAVPTRPSMAVELARITVPASGGGAATVDSSNRVYAAGVGGALVSKTLATAANTSLSTGWAAELGGGLSASFVAPLSGRVKITFSAYLVTNTANSRLDFGYAWSGGMTRNPTDDEILSVWDPSSSAALRASTVFTVDNLTPGTTYTLSSFVRNQVAASATVGVTDRRLLVEAM